MFLELRGGGGRSLELKLKDGGGPKNFQGGVGGRNALPCTPEKILHTSYCKY